jgi:hypothetical protein
MKFDPKQPYGVITGHSWARYEQNGVLFDGQGKPDFEPEMEEEALPDPGITNTKDFGLNNARDFLTNILADGSLPRSVVFKECSVNNQEWEKVKTAFADMGGEVTQRKNVIHWKLKTK